MFVLMEFQYCTVESLDKLVFHRGPVCGMKPGMPYDWVPIIAYASYVSYVGNLDIYVTVGEWCIVWHCLPGD